MSVKESKNDTIKRLVRENHRLQDELVTLRRNVKAHEKPPVRVVETTVFANQSSSPALLRVSSDLYKTKKLLDWHRRMESILKKANLELKEDLNTRIDPKYLIAVCTAITGGRNE